MPNWNYAHYVVMGDNRQLNDLAELLNGLFFKKPVRDSDFGTHWLANFHNAFYEGFFNDPEKKRNYFLRGGFEICLPRDKKDPTKTRPLTDDEKRSYFRVEDGRLHFSVYCAYAQSPVVENDILERFPLLRVFFQSETEMYDDGCIYDPEGKAGFPYFYFCDGVTGVTKVGIGAHISMKPYFKNDLGKIAEDLHRWGPKLPLPETLTFEYLKSKEFKTAFSEERDRLLKEGGDVAYSSYTAFSIIKE